MDLTAEIECVDESVAGTEASGLGDDDATFRNAALDDAPWNAEGDFSGEKDAGGAEGFQDEGCGLATREDKSGRGRSGEDNADLAV